MKTIVLGPPGTGKTTTLLNKVDDYLKETDPDKVGYFAFTQKAAYEARDRAIKKFNLTEDDLPYFRTLHSLAFRKLGLKKENVMQRRHYVDLGKKLGLKVGRLAIARMAPVRGSKTTMAPARLSFKAFSAANCNLKSSVSSRSLPA